MENITHNSQLKVYFIGIGGIGMSALARYYHYAGALVAGYDRTTSPLTKMLELEGINIHYEDNIALIPKPFLNEVKRDNGELRVGQECSTLNSQIIIYTPAVPANHGELCYFRDCGYRVIKRSQALGYIAAKKTTLAIAGTHGKTTTSTMLAHILTHAGNGCTAFLGGISKNYNTNLLFSSASSVLVAEADEFDRSFLQLFPHIAIITSTDADHLDIYGNHDAVKQAFVDFAQQVQPGGTLIHKKENEKIRNEFFTLNSPFSIYQYSCTDTCSFYASNIRQTPDGLPLFDLHLLDMVIHDCKLGIPGHINVENAVAAAAAAYMYLMKNGITECKEWINKKELAICNSQFATKIKEAFATFAGVQRRFDIRLNTPQCTYMDDYAHHPEELRAAITSLRHVFPNRRITGIFQPHLYTRTRDFADGFASALSLLDELILLDIYPAREYPIEGVSSQLIFDNVTIIDKIICSKTELMDILTTKDYDVLATFGAGDIDRFVQPITELLTRKYS